MIITIIIIVIIAIGIIGKIIIILMVKLIGINKYKVVKLMFQYQTSWVNII